MSVPFVRTVPLPPPVWPEVARYARTVQDDPAARALFASVWEEAEGVFTPRAVFCECPLRTEGDRLYIGGITLTSGMLSRTLAGATRALAMAATVGPMIDRLILRYSRLSPARALMLQALGTERIETALDVLCADLTTEYGYPLTPRKSPGYGDLPLSLQRDLFALLTPERRIGLSLTDSLLMTPSKSVTAFIGICDKR